MRIFDAIPKKQIELVQLLQEDDVIGVDDGVAMLRTEESAAPFAPQPGGLVLDRFTRLSGSKSAGPAVASMLSRAFSPQDLL